MPTTTRAPSLRRALGPWDLTALGINSVIGGAIFLMPSRLAAAVGPWAVPGFLLAGLATLLVALCFAEVASRFTQTGGPLLYTRAAFGRFAGFEVGWMQWVTRVTSQASIVNGLMLALGFYWPAAASGRGRAAGILLVTTVLTAVMVRGIRQSAWLVNTLTVGKLLPLVVLILFGLPQVEFSRLTALPPVSWSQISSAALLMIFVFGGFDTLVVVAGEAVDPRRHMPVALLATVAVVTLVMTLAQVVATGTLPDLAGSTTPLADAAMVTIGAAGALLVSVGSMLSMTGNNVSSLLSGPRVLFALAEQGDLPAWFGRVHPRYRTPANAFLFHAAVVLALALTGSFAALAGISAVARLVTYVGPSAATLALRSGTRAGVGPALFTAPFGPVVPLAALATSAFVVAGVSWSTLGAGGAALAAGALLFGATRWRAWSGARPPGARM